MEFQRSPRLKLGAPKEEVKIHPPASAPSKPTFNYTYHLIYMSIGLIITSITFFMYYYMSYSRNSMMNPTWLLFPLITGVSMLLYNLIPFLTHQLERRKYKKECISWENKYDAYLQERKDYLEQQIRQVQSIVHKQNPAPTQCLQQIKQRTATLWERTPSDGDFLSLRVGLGEIPSTIQPKLYEPDDYQDHPLITKAQQMFQPFQVMKEAPILLPIFSSNVIGIAANERDRLSTLRSLILQLVSHHSPDEVKIAAFFAEYQLKEWDWLRWFPHTWDDERKFRFLAGNEKDKGRLTEYLSNQFQRRKHAAQSHNAAQHPLPYWVIILPDPIQIENTELLPFLLNDAKPIGAHTIFLQKERYLLPQACRAVIELQDQSGKLWLSSEEGREEGDMVQDFTADTTSQEVAEEAARALAPLRLRTGHIPNIPSLLTLFESLQVKEIDDIQANQHWNQNRFPLSLPIPVGFGEGAKEIQLNLHDKIERGGHGPHGLIAGTTGSGKSEVIQSLIASTAFYYHPHDVVFLLIDYKGGGMSNSFLSLPHVVGTITNLDQRLIERAKISLKAELRRRETIFKQAGNLQHIDEYYQSPFKETNPLPHLVIIIDEFAELKKEQPEFMDELISIAAKGRTLGVHLLLATQKPGGVVDDKIWSNARFRICLRVQDEADSSEMIKRPDAAWITVPGRGYFQVGSNELFQLVQFAWSGAPYESQHQSTPPLKIWKVHLNGERIQPWIDIETDSSSDEEGKPKQLSVFIDQIAQQASQLGLKPLNGPWLPPLPRRITQESLMSQQSTQTLHSNQWLQSLVGLADRPMSQSQPPLFIPLANGHLSVYGMPGTGKTTFVQTLLLSLAQSHTPEQVHIYLLDFGHMFGDWIELPHVGACIRDHEVDRIQRLFRFLQKQVSIRREQLAQAGSKTYLSYRNITGKEMPAIIVVIDGYVLFRKAFENENQDLIQLLREGLAVGIHFILTANGLSDIFDIVRSQISLAVSFQLADPSDYTFAVGRIQTPTQLPAGRGFYKSEDGPIEFQTALPSAAANEIQIANRLRELFQKMRQTWDGNLPPLIQSLPAVVPLTEILHKQPFSKPLQAPVAIDREDFHPVQLSLTDGPYFLITSSIGGGKTSFLQTVTLSLAYHTSPALLEIYLIDIRPDVTNIGTLQPLPHVKQYITEIQTLEAQLQELQERMEAEPTPSATLLIIDHGDQLYKQMDNNFTLKDTMDQLVNQGITKNLFIIMAGSSTNLPQYNTKDWLSEITQLESGLLFASRESEDLSFMNIPVSESRSYNSSLPELQSGEGFITRRGRYLPLKAAWVSSAHHLDLVRQIQEKWSKF